MSQAINNINSKLGSVSTNANLSNVVSKTFEAKNAFLSSQLSKLGTEVNSVFGGFQSLTQEVDDDIENTPAAAGGIAMLVQDPPSLNIKKQPSSSNNDLQAITEETVDGGFLNIDVTAATPEAMTKALTRITGKSPQDILPAMREVSPDLQNITGSLPTAISQFAQGIAGIAQSLDTALTSFQANITSALTGEISSALDGLADNISKELPALSSVVKNSSATASFDPVAADYTYVGSQLEVTSLLTTIEREITTVVVGTTETFKDQDVRASNAKGWHFIITRTGELQLATPVSTVGNYANNYNVNTIGIAFAGGLDATFTEAKGKGKEPFRSVTSISREQYNTFDKFMKSFYSVYPHGQALGLENIPNTNTSAPGFDVIDYVYKRFGKYTIVDVNKPAPTIRELQIQMSLAVRKSGDSKFEDEPSEG